MSDSEYMAPLPDTSELTVTREYDYGIIVRDRPIELAARASGVTSMLGTTAQPLFQFKDYDSLSMAGGNDYFEHGRRVDDFTVRIPKMVNHIAKLCVCHHSLDDHTVIDFGHVCPGVKPDGSACRCERFEPVAAKASRHSYKRGQRTLKKTVSMIRPGDKVLCGWASTGWGLTKVRLTDQREHAMIATVTSVRPYLSDAKAGDQGPRDRALVVTTDLGESIPQIGGIPVLVTL